MKLVIIGCILSVLLLTACLPVQEASPETASEVEEKVQEPMVVQQVQLDPEIAEMVEKSRTADNYRYFYKKTTSIASSGYLVFYYKGKIRKEYSTPVRVSKTLSYDTVYLDPAGKTAFAVCESLSVACQGLRLKIYPIAYSTEELPYLPHLLSQGIPADAVIRGDELIEQRKTMIVDYGTTTINLDKFSGLVMKYVVEGSGEEHSFTQLGLNSVKPEEVEVPKGYVVVEK